MFLVSFINFLVLISIFSDFFFPGTVKDSVKQKKKCLAQELMRMGSTSSSDIVQIHSSV